MYLSVASNSRYQCFTQRTMGLLETVSVNVFDIVSCPCPDRRISLLPLTGCTKYWLSSVEKCIKRTVSMPEDLSSKTLNMDLLLLHGSGFSMPFKVTFRRRGNHSTNDACKVQSLWSNRQVIVSKTLIYCPFLVVAWVVCKMCLVWKAKWRDNYSSNGAEYLLEWWKWMELWQNSTNEPVHSTPSHLISPLRRYVPQLYWVVWLKYTTHVPNPYCCIRNSMDLTGLL